MSNQTRLRISKHIRTWVFLAIAGAVLSSAGYSAAHAQSKKPIVVPVLNCPFGCGLVAGTTIFANIMAKNNESIMIAAQETPGNIYNLRAMAEKKRWKTHVALISDIDMQLGHQGGQAWVKEFIPEPVKIKFKALHGTAFWAQGKFFITTDPNIKSIGDIKGKRVSVGLRSQSDWGLHARLFLDAYGITPENTDIRHMPPGALTQQLIDGSTDVAVAGYATEPTQQNHLLTGPLRMLNASGKSFYYIPNEESMIDMVNEKWSTTFVSFTIKKGTLPKQDKDFLSGFTRHYYAVHADFPEEVAYQFVKAVHKYRDEMSEINALWSLMTDEMLVEGLTDKNTHPGAIRAFKEVGIWNLRKKSVPMTYPKSN